MRVIGLFLYRPGPDADAALVAVAQRSAYASPLAAGSLE